MIFKVLPIAIKKKLNAWTPSRNVGIIKLALNDKLSMNINSSFWMTWLFICEYKSYTATHSFLIVLYYSNSKLYKLFG